MEIVGATLVGLTSTDSGVPLIKISIQVYVPRNKCSKDYWLKDTKYNILLICMDTAKSKAIFHSDSIRLSMVVEIPSPRTSKIECFRI